MKQLKRLFIKLDNTFPPPAELIAFINPAFEGGYLLTVHCISGDVTTIKETEHKTLKEAKAAAGKLHPQTPILINDIPMHKRIEV